MCTRVRHRYLLILLFHLHYIREWVATVVRQHHTLLFREGCPAQPREVSIGKPYEYTTPGDGLFADRARSNTGSLSLNCLVSDLGHLHVGPDHHWLAALDASFLHTGRLSGIESDSCSVLHSSRHVVPYNRRTFVAEALLVSQNCSH